MSKSEFLTRFSIWVTLAGYTVGVALIALSRKRPRLSSSARWAWTLACVSLLLHVIFAYHYYHQWSQDSAYSETARQTKEVVGLDWGGGLYFNYALIAGWVLDVAWWWRGLDYHRNRPVLLTVIWHGFLMFMIFNATVVFETGTLRIVGIIVFIVLCILLWHSGASRTQSNPDVIDTGTN